MVRLQFGALDSMLRPSALISQYELSFKVEQRLRHLNLKKQFNDYNCYNFQLFISYFCYILICSLHNALRFKLISFKILQQQRIKKVRFSKSFLSSTDMHRHHVGSLNRIKIQTSSIILYISMLSTECKLFSCVTPEDQLVKLLRLSQRDIRRICFRVPA